MRARVPIVVEPVNMVEIAAIALSFRPRGAFAKGILFFALCKCATRPESTDT